MLGKLIKYEFKGSGRLLVPLYGLIIVLALITKIFNKVNITDFNILGQIAMGIVVFIYGLTIMAIMLTTVFLIIQRFASTVYGAEGYLTHTLPVKSSYIIISKIISAIVWSILSGIISFISIMIIGYQKGMFADLFQAIEMLKTEIGAEGIGQIISLMSNMMLTSIIGITATIMMIYMCISIGQLFKRKFVGSIMAYLGISFAANVITALSGTILGEVGFFDFMLKLENITSANEAVAAFNHFMLIISVFYVIKIVVYYFITNHLMTKKLNLE